jgi:acetyl-CoA carboxylase carboxyl transferase subunit alpha
VDEIIPEPLGGAHTDSVTAAQTLREYLLRHLEQLQAFSAADRLKQRYAKFRAFGHFTEKQPTVAEKLGG